MDDDARAVVDEVEVRCWTGANALVWWGVARHRAMTWSMRDLIIIVVLQMVDLYSMLFDG